MLALGILSIVLSTVSWFFCWWLSIPGFVLGILGLALVKPDNANYKGIRVMSILGIILGVAALVVYLVSIGIVLAA